MLRRSFYPNQSEPVEADPRQPNRTVFGVPLLNRGARPGWLSGGQRTSQRPVGYKSVGAQLFGGGPLPLPDPANPHDVQVPEIKPLGITSTQPQPVTGGIPLANLLGMRPASAVPAAAPVQAASVAAPIPARPVFGVPLGNPSATPGWMAGGNGIETPQNQGMQAAFAQNAPAIRGAIANAGRHGLVGIAKATGRELAKTGSIVGNAALGAGKAALFGVDANSTPAQAPEAAAVRPPVGLSRLVAGVGSPLANGVQPESPFAPQPVPQGGPQAPADTPTSGIFVGGKPWTGGSTNPDDVQGNVEKSTPAPMIGAASATRNGVTIGSYTAGQNRNTARQAAVEAERSMAGGQGTPGLGGTFLAKYRPEDAPVMSGIVRPTAADAARARILASAPSRFDAQGRQIDTRARDEQQAQAAQFQQQKDLARMQGQTAVDVATKQAETAMGIRNLNAETKANEIALQNQGRLDATNAAAQAKADAVGSSEKTKSEVAGLLDELAALDMTKPKSGLSHLNPWNEDPSADDLASKRAAVIKKLKLYGYDENGRPLEVTKTSNLNAGGISNQTLPTVKTQAEYAKLPPGAKYIGPDGQQYTKKSAAA